MKYRGIEVLPLLTIPHKLGLNSLFNPVLCLNRSTLLFPRTAYVGSMGVFRGVFGDFRVQIPETKPLML